MMQELRRGAGAVWSRETCHVRSPQEGRIDIPEHLGASWCHLVWVDLVFALVFG